MKNNVATIFKIFISIVYSLQVSQKSLITLLKVRRIKLLIEPLIILTGIIKNICSVSLLFVGKRTAENFFC